MVLPSQTHKDMPITSGINANVFRAVSGSLFSTAANWSRGFVPTDSDVADIRDNCIIDISRTIRSLVVQPGFTASINTGLTLNISQSINVLGHLSCSGTPTVNILGQKNNINSLSPASSSFFYLGSTQTIPGVTYWTLSIRNPGVKTSNGTNTTVLNFLNVRDGSTYDIFNSNLTVNGIPRIGENAVNSGTLRKTGIGGSVLFTDRVDFNNAGSILSGNPRVEMRNGFTISNINNSVSFGDNDLYFTTNNQSIYESSNFFSFSTELSNNIFISGGISLTLDYLTTTLRINRPINGLSANDVLINKGRLYFNTANSVNTMVTGGFDYSTFNNFIGYTGNYSTNMLPYSSSYRNLYITGTGVKTLPRNTSVSGTLSLDSGGTLDMGNFDLIVSGTATIGANAVSSGFLQKSTPGNIIFIGRPYFFLGFITLTNNPTVEFRNGLDVNYTPVTFNSNNIRFTTNNQMIFNSSGISSNVILSGSALISGSINLTVFNNPLLLDGPINGFSASDTLINSGSIFFASAAALTGSLLTGSSNFSFPGNTVAFSGNYSATSSTKLNTFFNLVISGNGTKTLGTSSYVSGSLTLNSSTIFELSSSNLFISGTTTGTLATLSKSGSGKITFGGFASFINGNTINFTGHPTVEFQNGVFAFKNNAGFQYLGTGSFIFSTRNQNISFGNNDFNGGVSPIQNLIVSGAISVTGSSPCIIMINDTITGTDPGSIFKLGPNSLYINSTSSIMPIGSIDLSDTGSTIGFTYSDLTVANYNIPYTNFSGSLILGGQYTTKSLSGDTYVRGAMNGGYAANSGIVGTLECGNYNLFVSGAISSMTRFFKSGPGYVTFNGNVTMANGNSLSLTGNPTVEFRNSLYLLLNNTGFWNTGTGSFVFTTNPSQTLFLNHPGYAMQNPIIISGSVNLVYNGSSGVTHFGVFNGTDANSKLTINNSQIVYYNASQQPMLTGSIDFSSSLNTFIYNSGSQNVKGGVYRNLTFLNGLKTLQGNVSVLGTFSTGSGATSGSINLNGFTLTNP